jgi:hypothetical protein
MPAANLVDRQSAITDLNMFNKKRAKNGSLEAL